MKNIKTLFSDQIIEAFGWTIFHSVWQALVLLLVLLFVLALMRKYSARIRYFIAYSALLGVLLWSTGTAVKSYNYAKEKLVLKEQLLSNPEGIKAELRHLITQLNDSDQSGKRNKNLKWLEFKAEIQSNFTIIFYLWLIGVMIFLVKMASGLAVMQKLTRQKNAPLDDKWNKLINELQHKLKLKQKVEVLQSYLTKVPMVVGKLKPVILIPAELLTGLSQAEIEAIIAHELAHIRRNDYMLNILQSVIETLFFYHPAVWVISRIIRDEREHACDDMAIEATGDKLNYIKALAVAQEYTLKLHYNAVAFAQSKGGLLTRVKRIKTMSDMKNKVTEGFLAATLVFFSLVLLSFTHAGEPRQLTDDFDSFRSSDKTLVLSEEELKPENLKLVKDTLTRKVQKRVKEDEVSEDIETVIELAMLEQNEEMAAEILASIEQAFNEIEWEQIQVDIAKAQAEIEALNVDSLMREAKIEMEMAHAEIESLNLDSIMAEARAEIEYELAQLENEKAELALELNISEEEAMEIAHEALEVAEEALEAINLDSILKISLGATLEALQELELNEIIKSAVEGIEISFDTDSGIDKENLENLERELDELEKMK